MGAPFESKNLYRVTLLPNPNFQPSCEKAVWLFKKSKKKEE
jgi:hypothetical protein